MMEVHGYIETGAIEATVDGQRVSIPNDPSNRHRQMIAEWEAEGNTIAPYVAPPPTEQEIRVETFKADPVRVDMLQRLKTATPEEIETYITNNVTSLAQARTFLIALTKVLAITIQD